MILFVLSNNFIMGYVLLSEYVNMYNIYIYNTIHKEESNYVNDNFRHLRLFH